MPAKQLRRTCGTWWDVEKRPEPTEKMSYLVFSKEQCPSTQRLHWQLYVEFHKQVTFNYIIKLWPGIHIPDEGTKGDWKANTNYCSKEYTRVEGPFVWGEPRKQGARTDLYGAIDLMREGGMKRLREEAPDMYVKYARGFQSLADGWLLDSLPPFRQWQTRGHWYWGSTGTGKSHAAFNFGGEWDPARCFLYITSDAGFWTAYRGQPVVVINDFRGKIDYNELLQLVDKWPHEVKRKNLEPCPFLARDVIITSSLPPEKVYKHRDEEDAIEQLLRRFTVKKFSCLPGTWPTNDAAQPPSVSQNADASVLCGNPGERSPETSVSLS